MRIPRFPKLAHELVSTGYPYSQKSASIEGGYRRFKTSIDFVLAVVLLLISAPIIAFSMILVRLTSEGPSI
jgi:lipopolysaccharide/colanic/teichoic acid biosynthesis glycosyltransferase